MSKILKISILLLFLVVFFLPLFVSAQESPVTIEPPISWEIAKASPAVIIGKVIQWIMGVIGALAVLMIVYGGLQYMFSGGDERQVKQAKGILTWAIVGLLVSVFAYSIVWMLFQAVGAE